MTAIGTVDVRDFMVNNAVYLKEAKQDIATVVFKFNFELKP